MGYPSVQKSKDPRYTDAKKKLLILEQDTEKLVGTMSQMLSQMRDLSSILLRMGINISNYFEDTDEENTKNKILTIESFVRSFDNLTSNFLLPRLNPLIIEPLARFQKEIYRLQGVKIELKAWRSKYDYNRTYYEYYSQRQSNQEEIDKWKHDYEESEENYTKYNEDFINSISNLMKTRTQMIEKPCRIFISIISQYYHQIFTELQKFRTTFPDAIDNGKQNQTAPKQSIKSIVFSEEDENIPQT